MNHFYVYVLFRPWDGTPFYVGKGKGARMFEHESRKRHYNARMRNIIQKAFRLGLEIPKVIVRDGLSEGEAFLTEIAFIAAIGRKLSDEHKSALRANAKSYALTDEGREAKRRAARIRWAGTRHPH